MVEQEEPDLQAVLVLLVMLAGSDLQGVLADPGFLGVLVLLAGLEEPGLLEE